MSILRVYSIVKTLEIFHGLTDGTQNNFTGQESFPICSPFFFRIAWLFFSSSQCLPSCVLFLSSPPAPSWGSLRSVSPCILFWRSTKSKFWWVFPPYSSDVHVRIRARCWFFSISPAWSENGSDPCGPLGSGCSADPRINDTVHDLCDFPCVKTWTWNCQYKP